MVRVPTHEPPTHPGEVLLEEFLEPLEISQVEFARKIGVPVQRVNEIIKGKRGVSESTALRLSRALNTSPGFWLNLQMRWNLYQALHSREVKEIEKIEPFEALASHG